MAIEGDLKYMMRRSLLLLLSDVRPTDVSYNNSVDFLPEFGVAGRLEGPHLLPMILLINLWSSVYGLCERVLPKLSLPHAWTPGSVRVTTDLVDGAIDWGETFRRWSLGEKGYLVRDRRREIENSHAEYASFVLGETLTHCKTILESVKKSAGKAEPISDLIQGVEERSEIIQKALAGTFSPFYNRVESRVRAAEKVMRQMLDDPSGFPGGLRDYARKIQPSPPCGSFTTDSIEKLGHWRSQYLACSVWLSEKTGFKLQQRRDVEHLYEMWCFMELCVAARRLGLGETTQRTFIARNRTQPEFVLGSGQYVCYDYRAARFRSPAAKMQKHLREAGILRPALRGTFVEWFVLDLDDYGESIVIDAKYSRWNSREALKVLGYLMSFGVRRGILLLARGFDPVTVGGVRLDEGLSRIDCPGDPAPRLWIASLVPDRSGEAQNFAVLSRLLGETLAKPIAE